MYNLLAGILVIYLLVMAGLASVGADLGHLAAFTVVLFFSLLSIFFLAVTAVATLFLSMGVAGLLFFVILLMLFYARTTHSLLSLITLFLILVVFFV